VIEDSMACLKGTIVVGPVFMGKAILGRMSRGHGQVILQKTMARPAGGDLPRCVCTANVFAATPRSAVTLRLLYFCAGDSRWLGLWEPSNPCDFPG